LRNINFHHEESDGDIYKTTKYTEAHFEAKGHNKPENHLFTAWGSYNFVKREDILEEVDEILQDDSLTFVICIKPNVEYYYQSKHQQPVLGDNMFTKLVNDEETADLSFTVGKELSYPHKSICLESECT
jgi:hypothetical protein